MVHHLTVNYDDMTESEQYKLSSPAYIVHFHFQFRFYTHFFFKTRCNVHPASFFKKRPKPGTKENLK
jgi:hypothetical protein